MIPVSDLFDLPYAFGREGQKSFTDCPTPATNTPTIVRKPTVMRDVAVDVVVANEPLAYREALAATLREIRPDVETVVVAPSELDHAAALHKPRVVVCSELTDAIEGRSWALLYPHGASWSELNIAGKR